MKKITRTMTLVIECDPDHYYACDESGNVYCYALYPRQCADGWLQDEDDDEESTVCVINWKHTLLKPVLQRDQAEQLLEKLKKAGYLEEDVNLTNTDNWWSTDVNKR